jgi:cellulose 1,4-beta-cellobiosidase
MLLALLGLQFPFRTPAVGVGKVQTEGKVMIPVTVNGTTVRLRATLDANWRWVHFQDGYQNCFDSTWLCTDTVDCERCVLEGVSTEQYKDTYGIQAIDNGLQLQFVTRSNVGSRLYLVDDATGEYFRFVPLNTRVSFDLDLRAVPCAVNAAVYLVNISTSAPLSALGVGYGDAQCPTDIKYATKDGTINLRQTPSCAQEIDLTEANSEAMAWTLHPCRGGVCDKPGADMNSYRQGFLDFYGPGKTLDTTQPFTVVTEFRENSMTRYYIQKGQRLDHPAGPMTYASVSNWTQGFGEQSDFQTLGGFSMFSAEEYVFVISLWDDTVTNMQWLDGVTGSGLGSVRGPCGGAENPRNTAPDAHYTFSNLVIEVL